MKLFALPKLVNNNLANPSMFFSTVVIVILLPSCSAYQQSKQAKEPVAPIVFNYSYQEPYRQSVDSALSEKLSNGKAGDMLFTKFNGKQTTIRLGNRYYSASGYECRKYTVNPSNTKAACKINNRWYRAKPILIKK